MYRLILFTISILFITVSTFYIGFCLGILIKPEILKSGILTTTFNFPNLHLRGILSRDNVINSLQNEITSSAEIATAAVPAITQTAASAISSAVDAAERAVNSVIPKSCTLGTKYLCVSFSSYTPPCLTLPLNTSSPLSGGLANLSKIDQLKDVSPLLQSLQDIDRALSTITTQYIEGYFAFGLTSAIIALALGIFLSYSIWVQRQQYNYHVLGLDIPIVDAHNNYCVY